MRPSTKGDRRRVRHLEVEKREMPEKKRRRFAQTGAIARCALAAMEDRTNKLISTPKRGQLLRRFYRASAAGDHAAAQLALASCRTAHAFVLWKAFGPARVARRRRPSRQLCDALADDWADWRTRRTARARLIHWCRWAKRTRQAKQHCDALAVGWHTTLLLRYARARLIHWFALAHLNRWLRACATVVAERAESRALASCLLYTSPSPRDS